MRRTWWLGVVFLCAFVAAATAEPKAPGKGFWRVLVTPHPAWVLRETTGTDPGTVTIETYDIRKIGDAEVARLRWTWRSFGESRPFHEGAGQFTQFAVTASGLYILSADMDDAAVAKALQQKPARSDPPKAYDGTKRNEGRYLMIMNGDVVMGKGPRPGDPPCADTCDGSMTISATAGITQLLGTWAPNFSVYAQTTARP